MEPIAHIETPFAEKFGIPRQSGIVAVKGRVVFEPKYRVAEAVRGLEGFDYIWLLWQFSQSIGHEWSATVRPPRLGGNQRMGVFATRSPFRPNPIGLSSVSLKSIDYNDPRSPILDIEGADLMDGTPIYDIKPYLPYTDSHPDARSGFAVRPAEYLLDVDFSAVPDLPESLEQSLREILAHDPRPQYHNDAEREYGMSYGHYNILFQVKENLVVVKAITKRKQS